MKTRCTNSQRGIALLMDTPTSLSTWYKSKNALGRCDLSSRGHNLSFLTTIKKALVHISLQEFAQRYVTSKEWGITRKTSLPEPCQKRHTWRATAGVSPEDGRPGSSWLITVKLPVTLSWGDSYTRFG